MRLKIGKTVSIYWFVADEGMSKREMGKLEELSLQHKSIFICSQVMP